VNILDLQNKTEYTLYELDKNEEIQKQVIELHRPERKMRQTFYKKYFEWIFRR